MVSVSLLFGFLVAFSVPGLCCREKEYVARDGQCCPMCYEGTVVRKDCTLQVGTRCVQCENGTFMNQPNGRNSCFRCTSCVAVNGLTVKQACTAKTDTVCGVLSGYMCKSWSNGTGCSLAEKHSLCPPGQQIKESGTDVTDTVCADCQHGYFSQHGVKCIAWKVCSQPHDVVQAGDSRNDVVCRKSSKNKGLSSYDLLYPPLLIFMSLTCIFELSA